MRIRQGARLPALKGVAIVPEPSPGLPPSFVDLTQFVSITFRMVCGTSVVTGVASGDVNGNLTYNWGASDTAVVGKYAAYFIGTDTNGKIAYFPSDQDLVVDVFAAA